MSEFITITLSTAEKEESEEKREPMVVFPAQTAHLKPGGVQRGAGIAGI